MKIMHYLLKSLSNNRIINTKIEKLEESFPIFFIAANKREDYLANYIPLFFQAFYISPFLRGSHFGLLSIFEVL